MYRNSSPSRVDQKWNEQKVKLQNQFSSLTDNDLIFETGRKHEMIERIATKLGKTEAEIDQIFNNL
jgi:hypothetical protein